MKKKIKTTNNTAIKQVTLILTLLFFFSSQPFFSIPIISIQVEVVREFIGKYLGGENLAIFDSLWIEDDEERAMKIAELTGELDEEGILLDDEEDLSDESEFVDE